MARRIEEFIKDPRLLFVFLGGRGWWHWMDDEQYLKIAYWSRTGEKLNLDAPKNFNEKLQWLKIHDRKPEYTLMVDKYEAKKWVADKIGEKYIVPTFDVWDSADDISIENLPEQFILKCTHDSGGNAVCKNKGLFDLGKAKSRLSKNLGRNFYWAQREWPYKDVKPRVLAEEYLEDKNGELKDYKFFCFGGKAKFFKIDFDRQTDHHANYYDIEGNILPFGETRYPPQFSRDIKRPENLSLMIYLAERLSVSTRFLRVDFYEVDGKVYFGELTFFPTSGFGAYTDKKWNEKMGSWIEL